MRFWDSSALVPLLLTEPTTAALQRFHLDGVGTLVWWGTEVECASAVARLERQGKLETTALAEALSRLEALIESWQEIDPTGPLRETARRLLRTHDLRAADALQLAAAHAAAEGRPSTLEVVILDERLRLAAAKEGFVVLDPERGR
jgi:uncharacterized protein